jgi:hypothetical protein
VLSLAAAVDVFVVDGPSRSCPDPTSHTSPRSLPCDLVLGSSFL